MAQVIPNISVLSYESYRLLIQKHAHRLPRLHKLERTEKWRMRLVFRAIT